jgi:23S rRNA pseudouridine955/2504/2580 synthase
VSFRVRTDDVDRRVDRVVRRLLPRVPLSRLYQALREGAIRVNGARVAPATRTRAADLIWVHATLAPDRSVPRPPAAAERPARRQPGPAPPILYRAHGVVVVDKPAGLAVHGDTDSVMARLRQELAPHHPALSFAPAPVHQLDRITSGALVIAERLAAARQWSAALRTGRTVKLYLAVVAGNLAPAHDGTIWADTLSYDRRRRRARTGPGGRAARARVWALARAGAGVPATLLLVQLLTGRRHQIRAQAALRGHPLLGDSRYGSADPFGVRPLLHAAAIRNDLHPAGMPLLAPLPDSARQAIDQRFGSGTARCAESAVATHLRHARPMGGTPRPVSVQG